MSREPVPATPRASMTPRMRQEAYDDADGMCAWCGTKIAPGEAYDVDHNIPLWMGGAENRANRRPLHATPAKPCHKAKTRKDAADRAKVKRIHEREEGSRRPRQAIASPGFSKTLSRGFDNKVRPRAPKGLPHA